MLQAGAVVPIGRTNGSNMLGRPLKYEMTNIAMKELIPLVLSAAVWGEVEWFFASVTMKPWFQF